MDGKTKKLTREEWYRVSEQYARTREGEQELGPIGQHYAMMQLLYQLSYGLHLDKIEMMQFTEELLDEGYE